VAATASRPYVKGAAWPTPPSSEVCAEHAMRPSPESPFPRGEPVGLAASSGCCAGRHATSLPWGGISQWTSDVQWSAAPAMQPICNRFAVATKASLPFHDLGLTRYSGVADVRRWRFLTVDGRHLPERCGREGSVRVHRETRRSG
jgi:hypothetical protein